VIAVPCSASSGAVDLMVASVSADSMLLSPFVPEYKHASNMHVWSRILGEAYAPGK
jgi:hypothetical protein